MAPFTPHMYSKLCPKNLDKECAKKTKCFVVSEIVIQNFDMFVQQFALSIL
jgi:hypothetical protein